MMRNRVLSHPSPVRVVIQVQTVVPPVRVRLAVHNRPVQYPPVLFRLAAVPLVRAVRVSVQVAVVLASVQVRVLVLLPVVCRPVVCRVSQVSRLVRVRFQRQVNLSRS